MKDAEDEAFDELAKRQELWGGGYQAKRAMAAAKLVEDQINYGTSWSKNGERIDPRSVYLDEPAQDPWNEDEWRRNNWRCSHGWLRGEQCEICNAPQSAQEPVALVIDGVLVKSELPEKYTGHLYTTPPQREWVGLTPEETSGFTQHEMTVVKYVSKVLQEKNT